jgi:type 1 glutamine amidotransferase
MMEPGFVLTFLRGSEWAAAGKVTLPAKFNPVLARLDKIRTRALVVTGGHPYDTSFYGLFEGQDDLHWDHASSNHEAYKEDLRPNYDVLVLYDFVQSITDSEKKNLTDFVESGKGLVVLHHAIADYQQWPWWWETVVGGRYVLKPESGHPGSKYKHDEEMFVFPVAKHPVTSGISRMHIWDETYKDLWISPKAQVLLKTDNPTSDAPVAWIGPYDKARVVYIQLGHDRLAHVHPGYRALVRNAILWARGEAR